MGTKFKRKYDEYINSDAWAARRVAYFKFYPKKCSACGVVKNIHLHHLTYARMGSERDADLKPLCQTCHTEVHRIHRKNPTTSLQDVTFRYVVARKKGAKKSLSECRLKRARVIAVAKKAYRQSGLTAAQRRAVEQLGI